MNRIKEILEERGVKQTWLANKLDKSYNMVNSYVQNRRQPSIDDLFRIADILHVNVEELLAKKERISDNKKLNNPKITSESEEMESFVGKTTKVPLIGTIACGTPIFAEENIEAYIPVSVRFIKPSYKYFILRASGDSMNEAGINNGDLVLIRQQKTAQNGELVVALIDDEATIKEFRQKENMILLKPKSKSDRYQPIILTSDFRIQGVVETVIPINNF
jgi:repressor LexA